MKKMEYCEQEMQDWLSSRIDTDFYNKKNFNVVVIVWIKHTYL